MAMNKYLVEFNGTLEVSFNDDAMPDGLVPDDEWRSQFYGSLKTPEDVAEHFAYNHIVNGVDHVTRLDGWADRKQDEVSFGPISFDVEGVTKL